MKIAYITIGNPYDKHSWSGTDYYIKKALEDKNHTVYPIFGLQYRKTLIVYVKKLFAKLIGKTFDEKRTIHYSFKWAKYINSKLPPDVDVIVSIGTIPIAFLETKIPIFIVLDGVFNQMKDFYNWNILNIAEAEIIEKNALAKAFKILPCSNSASDYIMNFYKIPSIKIKVIPLGANLDFEPSEEMIEKFLLEKEKKTCKILFIGVDWERKGTDIVIETFIELRKRNFNVELFLVGLTNIKTNLPKGVINYGFLSKKDKNDCVLLEKLFLTSHFLFVPSIAEAYGLVFCEASAYALPSISHSVGGIPTIINDNVNGKLFPIGSNSSEFANYISNQFLNYESYLSLAKKSREEYLLNLNWNIAGERYTNVLKESI